jgi:hypothetical protein
MKKKVTIFGMHPIRDDIFRQFEAGGAEISVVDEYVVPTIIPDEIVILPSGDKDDYDAEVFLSSLAAIRKDQAKRRPLVHLLLKQPSSLRRLQVSDFEQSVNDVFEVFPFTMEETWAETIIARIPGVNSQHSPVLDREPITADSCQFVHLVIFGFDSYAESIAVKTAQVAHFPNYDGKSGCPLRTRITIITPDCSSKIDAFISRYHSLFDNSYYRTINLDERKSALHHPQYEGRREDFVDIEWEFVDGSPSNPIVVRKLSLWAKDKRRQLTIVVSGTDDNINLDSAIALPDVLLENGVPVWVRLHKDMVSRSLSQSSRYRSIFAFGMDTVGYDVDLPLVQISKLLHYFYACYRGAKGIPTSFPPEEVEKEWQNAGTLKMRLSNICNVLTMATKMHSLGHDDKDMHTFYALSDDEIKLLSRTEHNRWCVERLLSGTRVCTDEERAAIAEDIRLKEEFKLSRDAHYDLCAYDELKKDEKGIDVRTYDYVLTACIPLIVESFLTETVR